MNIRIPVVASIAAFMSLAASATTFGVLPGETKTLTDETIADYNGAVVDAGGTLILDTTAAPPFAITGAGTIRKGNDKPWTMTVRSKEFTGTWDLQGVVTVNGSNPFGANNSNGYRVVATNNATLALAVDPTLNDMKIMLAGTGYEGRGALEVGAFTSTSGYCFRNLDLADDATVTMKKDSTVIQGYGSIKLNGHKLRLVGGGNLQPLSTSISTDGEIEISGTPSATTKLTFRSWNSNSDIAGGVTDATDMKFTLAGYATINFFNRYRSFSRPLHVRGVGNNLQHSEQYGIDKDWSCEHMCWPGPIVFEDGGDVMSRLALYVGNGPCCFAITGPISGPGQIYADGSGCIYLGNPNNTYTGGTEFGSGHFILGYPGSIPDYGAFTNTSATSIRYAAGDGRWTMQDVFDFRDRGSKVPAGIRFDTELTGDEETASVSLAGATRGFADNETIGAYGERPTSITGGSSENWPFSLVWSLGYGVLTGTNPYFTYRINVRNSTANDFTSVLAVHDTTVVVATNGCVGAGLGSGEDSYGRLVITNALVCSEDPAALDKYNTYHESYATPSNALVVADGGRGILEVEAGAVITNRLLVGAHGRGAVWDNTSYGGVRQRGGKFVAADPNCTISKGNSLGVGQGAGGYYELLGGELESHGTFSIGCWGVGAMLIDGGTFTITNKLGAATKGALELGGANGGRGALRVTSGRVAYCGTDDIFVGRGNTADCFSSLTVDGEGAACDFGATRINFGWGNPSGTFFVNFNAGVLTAGKLYKHRRDDTSLYCLRNKLYLNFNGGTFRAGAPGEIFGAVSDQTLANAVFVYEGGATVDTQGNECTIRIPIAAPAGNGIKSIALAKPITHVMSPVVEIKSETGVGASAFAHYDWETHAIDRIDVTSAGSGYEDATVTLRYTSSKTDATQASVAEFAADAGTGSFTKKGSGILNLGATNTWGGATVLAGGTLRCLCDRAIPLDTTVELAGGSLAMNGMKMANGDPCPKKWAVDANRAKELGGAIPYAGRLDFIEGSTLEVRNAAEMGEDGEKLVLLEATDGFTGRPTLVGTVDPEWHVSFSAKKIVLAPNRGLMLIVR